MKSQNEKKNNFTISAVAELSLVFTCVRCHIGNSPGELYSCGEMVTHNKLHMMANIVIAFIRMILPCRVYKWFD